MLLIQSVTLTYGPGDRGGRGAEARSRFPLAYPVEPEVFAAPVGVHSLLFYQQGEELLTNEEECRRSLGAYLPRLGFSPEAAEAEMARRLRGMRAVRVLGYRDHTQPSLTNLRLSPAGEGWEAVFWWDDQRSGMPYRRGHNRDYNDPASRLYRRDCLNETAFVLAPGQTGRVLWNERRRDCDDGGWYYQLHAYSVAALPAGEAAEDVFTRREPDFLYRQMAELY